jgi:hypothetical protein
MTNNLINQQLTDYEKKFIDRVAEGDDVSLAGRAAGLTKKAEILRILAIPSVQDYIALAMARMLRTESAPAARRVLQEIMLDTKVAAKTRVDCAKALLDRAGFSPIKIGEDALKSQKSPSEMTGDELRREIERLNGEMVARADGAKLIEGVTSDDSTQALDILN